LARRIAWALFRGVPTHGEKVMHFLVIFVFKKLNKNYFYIDFDNGNGIGHTSL